MPSSDPAGSFKTHAGYMHAFAYLCGYTIFKRDPAVMAALATRIKREPSYAATVARPRFDGDQLRRSLDAAWGSELLLAITGAYAPEDLRGVSNTWVAIQAYYACYHTTQALVIAKGQPRPKSHPKTQKMFVDAWVSPRRNLLPWSLGAADRGYANLPSGHIVDESVHAWATIDNDSAVDLACKALRTTREDFLFEEKKRERQKKQKALRKAWQEEEAARVAKGRKPRKEKQFPLPYLKATEHAAVEARTRAYGLLDYLYRLRIKAQYEDSTLFSEGPEDPSQSLQIYQHIEQVVRSTLLLHELFIERIVGRKVLGRLIDAWIRRQASAPVNPLSDRRSLILP